MSFREEIISEYRQNGISAATEWIYERGLQISLSPVANFLTNDYNPLIIDDQELYRICQDKGKVFEYDSAKKIEKPLPDSYDYIDSKIMNQQGNFTITKPYVGTTEAKLLGTYPLVVINGKFPIEPLGSPQVLVANIYNTIKDISRDPGLISNPETDHFDSAVLLYNAWNKGYFHWTAETLTRLEGVERYRKETGNSPPLIIGPNPTSFQLESLDLLGYSEEDLIFWDSEYATVDKLILPTSRREADHRSWSALSTGWLRERMRSEALKRVSKNRFTSNVYITRNDASARQVVNEEAVMECLEKYGFERYTLSEMSVAETVALFSQADTIVAPHGAGLTDLIYSDEVSVIELLRGNSNTRVYYSLSKQHGFWYGCLHCHSVGPDLRVNVRDLEQMIQEATS
ncbi:glycosyltransferase family 61 protein [Halostella sp. JP-L12]|uniref:glycosyltransferase family 61 protein n=1 Tax=Halostella TaxID=1843185 RepID=UPI000EF83914|nr:MULTISPECIES: glycosyltransferase family 61 protein [Halostella]NHN46479.1 glycosyltransferase family 61 protein [Halostella sp. JP-L12]